MEEKRKAERLNDFNEITVAVISGDHKLLREKIAYKHLENISEFGAKIRGNILLPVNTILKIDFSLKTLEKQITALGQVKWIKVIIEDKDYEVGVEFVDTSCEAIQKIQEYISWKKKKAALKPFWIFAKYN